MELQQSSSLTKKVLHLHWAYAATYLDNMMISANTWADRLQKVREVLQSIWAAGLKANPAKCHPGYIETRCLGYILGHGKIRPLIDK